LKQGNGFDSVIGHIEGDGMRLFYDYGHYSTTPFDPRIAAGETFYVPPHLIWEESIGGLLFRFVKPVSPIADSRATTGVNVGSSSSTLTIFDEGLSGEQQDLAFAVFRSIGF